MRQHIVERTSCAWCEAWAEVSARQVLVRGPAAARRQVRRVRYCVACGGVKSAAERTLATYRTGQRPRWRRKHVDPEWGMGSGGGEAAGARWRRWRDGGGGVATKAKGDGVD